MSTMCKNNKLIISVFALFMAAIQLCSAQCPELEDVYYTQVEDCMDKASICLPIPLDQILTNALDITVNDEEYTDIIPGCEFDSIVAYSYFTMLGQGNAGPYHVESWIVDDQTFEGTFETIDDLVDSMNLWNPSGNWVHDAPNLNIVGGDLSFEYSDIHIEQLQLPGTNAILPFAYGLNATKTIFSFPVGTHTFEVTGGSECNVMMDVIVACTPNEYISETTYVGLSGEICLDQDDLLGNNPTVSICSSTNDDVVEFFINSENQCITFLAHEAGIETGCFVICDDLGICDSTYITVTSLLPPEGEIIIETVAIGQTLNECLSAEDISGTEFTISNQCPEFSGDNVQFNFENGSLCVEFTGITVGVDTACIVICNELGMCDSTMFYISAINPIGETPILLDDQAETMQNETVMIPVLDNDTVEYISLVSISEEPNNGSAYITMDNEIAYEPNEDFCGQETFSYMICNSFDCDTANVEVTVICEEITIYNGFSPNGDGVNDRFRIGGIESYPNCSVKVFNVWGNKVYENKVGEGYKYESGWDGTWNGKDLVDGNYFYMIELGDDSQQKYSGYILLHR